jgi:hypothetical protein
MRSSGKELTWTVMEMTSSTRSPGRTMDIGESAC